MRAHLKAFVDRRRNPDVKREAVLRTAVLLFLERGFWCTSLTDVAEKLNITKPALYHYFHNKEEIYLECYRWGVSLIKERILEIRNSDITGLEKAAAFIYNYTIVIADDFGRCVVRQDDRELSQKARKEVRGYKREVDRGLRAFLEEGVADGTICPCDIRLTAFSLAGAVNSLVHWFNPEGALKPETVAAEFVKTLIGGIATPVRRRDLRDSLALACMPLQLTANTTNL